MATTSSKPTADQRAETAANYHWAVSMLNSDPELKKLFAQATDPKNNWSPDRFQAELMNTKWFQTHSANQRQALIAAKVDPTTWQATVDGNAKALKDNAATMGAVLSDKQLAKMASDMTVMGWNQAQQQDHLASYVTVAASGVNKGQYIGAAGQNAQAMRKTAEDNGYTISDKDLAKWTKAIAAGDETADNYQRYMRRQAALTFPSFADELYAGQDMKSVAQPYFNSMAKILELDPDTLDLQDPTIRKALASKDPKTGKPAAMAIYDFEDGLRKDNRWQYTDGAHNDVLGMGRQILQLFGKSI